MIKCYFDGSYLPDKKIIGCGAIIIEDNKIIKKSSHKYKGKSAHHAEWRAMLNLFKLAKSLNLKDLQLTIYGDSLNIINSMKGRKVGLPAYQKRLRVRAIKYEKRFLKIRYKWIPRHKNKLAHSYAKYALNRSISPH